MTFALYNIEFNNNTAKIQFPPICPHCNLGIVPEILYVSKLTERKNFGDNDPLEIFNFECTNFKEVKEQILKNL